MRVLLTGAGGFVGHHTLAHLLKTTNWDFVITDSFRHQGTTARIRSVFEELPQYRNRVTVVVHDLRVPFDNVTINEIGECEVAINMASESHVDRSIIEPRSFIENNVQLMLTMVEWARRQSKLKLFLQISTDEVFGPAPEGSYHKEWDSICPSNPYSASKASQEAIATSYWRTYDIPIIITNTMNIIGERQDVEKFVPRIIDCLSREEKVPVHAQLIEERWTAGSRFYLHARNQADALRYLIDNYLSEVTRYSQGLQKLPRFNIVGEREISNDEMVRLIADFMGIQNKSNIINYVNVEGTRPGHDLRYALDGSKMSELGWSAPVKFEESLRRTVQWSLANRSWLL